MAYIDPEKERGTINFARGVPPPEAFPTQELQECARAVLEREGSVVLQYHPAAGFVPLREWLADRYGVAMECVLVSNGSLQILDFLTRLLTSPGDVVLVEKPSYDRAITLFRQEPDFFYTIPDFQNPTGITTSLAKREKLVELAERHDFWIVEDGPYRDLRYWGEEVPAIFSLGSEKVLHLSSFSKVLSPGMRVGYLLGPEHVVRKLTKMAEDTYITPNMVSQGVVYEYCRQGWLGPNIERLKSLYRPRLEALASALQAYLPHAQWARPEGGFFVGAYLPSEVDVSLLKAKAQEERVTLSDGRGFFPDEDGSAFLRLPFCALSAPNIQEGIGRLGSIVNMLIRRGR